MKIEHCVAPTPEKFMLRNIKPGVPFRFVGGSQIYIKAGEHHGKNANFLKHAIPVGHSMIIKLDDGNVYIHGADIEVIHLKARVLVEGVESMGC